MSVIRAEWAADGSLLFISDQDEWWNLYTMLPSGGQPRNLYPQACEIGGPHWVFGNHPFAVDPLGSGMICTTFGKVSPSSDVASDSFLTL